MTKIAKIEISDFRGFESVRSFDFEDADIVIFLGMNGFGKTSIFDAVEWCLTGHISRYESYLTSGRKLDFADEKKILRNKYASNPHSLVKIDLTDGKKFGRRVMLNKNGTDYGTGSVIDGFEFGINGISTQPIDHDVINNYFSATHILSQETIHHFVTSKKPDDRYRALSVNFGTSLYEPFDDNIQRLIATLRSREDVCARKIEEARVRLQDLHGQLQARSGEIEAQVLDSNRVVSELNVLMPSIQISDYSLDGSKSKINGSSTEEIQKILTMVKNGTENAYLNLSLLKSLAADYSSWLTQNKELSDIDKKIIGNKKAVIKIKELDAAKASLESETHQINIELQKELLRKNNAEFIHKNIYDFLESKAQIDFLNSEITQRNNAAMEGQKSLLTLTPTILSAEQKLKEIIDWLEQSEVLKNELSAFIVKAAHKNELEKITIDSQKIINSTQELIEKLQSAESSIISNWLTLDMQHIEELKNIDATVDVRPLSMQMERLALAREVESRIKTAEQEKENLEARCEALIKNLSTSQAMLSGALELIPSDTTEIICPVCDAPHDTSSLLAIIQSKIEAVEASTLNKLKDEIVEINNAVASDREKYKGLIKDIENQKAIVINVVQGKIISLNAFIANKNSTFLAAKSELQQAELEEFKLIAKASSLLNFKLNSLKDIAPELEKKSVLQAAERDELRETIISLVNKKMEFEKSIELQSSTNRLSQERIATLYSPEYKKINDFISENRLKVDENLPIKIESYRNDLQRSYEILQQKLQEVSAHKDSYILQLQELTKDRTEANIEIESVALSNRITEISRFLSDYRERAMRAEVDLGSISPQSIGAAEVKHNLTITQNSKLGELLTHLLEKTRLFTLFSQEDGLRKKIAKVQEDVQLLRAEGQKIVNAKRGVDDLKKKFPKVLEKYITDNLDVKLFNQIYHSLNPHRRFKDINFKVDVSYNKVGINFNATDSTLNARPEFLFSSAQLNTFGVSMFLSMALRQNWLNLDTVLLDDPIQNLDDINVLSLIDLIRGLLDLKSKQVILSTHDERFYNLVKRKFADYKLKAFKFESYGRVMPD